jgi:hypothetical protein
MFHNDVSLIDTDFRIPATAYSFDNCFYNCGKLKTPIQNLFFEKGTMTFLYKTIGVRNLFNGCTSLTGTIPADILWNSDNTFTGTSNTFALCPDSIKSQAPVSWGGTASDNIIIDHEQVIVDSVLGKLPEVEDGKDGVTFTPSVDANGNLSWTNNGGLNNPASVNIKGDKGEDGKDGVDGTNGTNGTNGTDGKNGATFTPSVDANGNLSWTNDGGLSNPSSVNIKGEKGEDGKDGVDGTNGTN